MVLRLYDQAHDLFSPFTSLNPLADSCSKNGFETLDNLVASRIVDACISRRSRQVYFPLENLSHADLPYKSVSALNCANIWELNTAYQTFETVSGTFDLNPDIHSSNAVLYAFGKLNKAFEASRKFEHLVSVKVKPNAMSYSLLVDAHISNRDHKAAPPAVIKETVTAGFGPTKDTLKKLRRQCIPEMDNETDVPWMLS